MNEIIGDWLQGFRTEHGLTLDQIATASHRYGTGWNNVNIMRIERGNNKADSLPTLIILLATLNDLTDSEITIADIFTDYAGSVTLTADGETSYENIVAILEGEPVSFRNSSSYKWRMLHEYGLYKKNLDGIHNRVAEKYPDITDFFDHGRPWQVCVTTKTHDPVFNVDSENGEDFLDVIANHIPTAAEKRLENRLYSTDAVLDDLHTGYVGEQAPEGFIIAAICDVLYGHSLDQEAAKRAGDGASPQKRGRVTRVLEGEILDYMHKVAAKLED